jgi:septum formation protein
MTVVVLGSASSGRLKVLRQAGIDPLVIVSGVDEDAVASALRSDTPAGETVCALAAAKADRAAQLVQPSVAADCVVIACDSMLYLDGQLRGKPESADAARRQWQSMAGRSGLLYTGHCLVRIVDGTVSGREADFATTTVYFGVPADDLDAYVDTGEPLQVAGGFTLDGLGGWFVDRVDGDPSNVIGLSLPLTRRLLQRVGLSVPQLWGASPR